MEKNSAVSDIDEDLIDKPEISVAVALNDHNFSDLKEFALNHVRSTNSSDIATVPSEKGSTSPEPDMEQDKPENMSHSAFSLSYILNSSDSIPSSHVPSEAATSESNLADANSESTMSSDIPNVPASDADEIEDVMDVDSTPNVSEKPSMKKGLLGWLSVKRKRSDGEESLSSNEESDTTPRKGSRPMKKPKWPLSAPGQSRSATASRNMRDDVKKGLFKPDKLKLNKWRNGILAIDENATLDETNCKRAFHSRCGRWVEGKDPYDTNRFRTHVKDRCDKRPPTAAANTPTVKQWSKKFNISLKTSNTSLRSRPCPGLTVYDDSRIPVYLERTGAIGGGARSITRITQEIFKKYFCQLSNPRKKEIIDRQIHEHRWQNDHHNDRVFSRQCLKEVLDSENGERVYPCNSCTTILRDAQFRRALNKKQPDDENLIYTNKRWQPAKKLIGLFARTKGLKELIENSVSVINIIHISE